MQYTGRRVRSPALYCITMLGLALLTPYLSGTTMKRKVMAAAIDMAEHTIEHDEFVSTLPDESVTAWTIQVNKWDEDSSRPNPFEYTVEGERFRRPIVYILNNLNLSQDPHRQPFDDSSPKTRPKTYRRVVTLRYMIRFPQVYLSQQVLNLKQNSGSSYSIFLSLLIRSQTISPDWS